MIRRSIEFLIVNAVFFVPALLLLLLVFFESARAAARFVLRFIARPLLLLAVLALVYDGTQTLAGGSGVVITSLAEHWQALAPRSFEALKAWAARLGPTEAWDGAAQRVLVLPAWLVIGILALLLLWAGRKRRRVNIYAN